MSKKVTIAKNIVSKKTTNNKIIKVTKNISNAIKEPDTEEKSKAEPKAKVKVKAEPKVKALAEPKVKAKGEPKVKAKAEPKVKAKGEPKVKAKAEPKVKAKAEPKVKAKAEPKVKAKAEPKVKAKAKPKIKANAKIDSEIKIELGEDASDTDTDTDTDTDIGANKKEEREQKVSNKQNIKVLDKKKIKGKRKKNIIINFDENNIYKLDDKAELIYYKDFVSDDLHDKLCEELKTQVPWTHGVYKMYGKPINTPRLLYSMRDEEFNVADSYTVTDSMPWTPNMLILKNKIEAITQKTYKYAQLNHYRNGKDYIGFHKDREVEAGDIIASISLGADRKFCFRSVKYEINNEPVRETTLEKGSLIIMNDFAAKHNWKHSLPKMNKLEDYRINITFRPN